MNRLLLDTSAYSAFGRGYSRLRTVLERATEIVFTPIVLGELHAGFCKGAQRRANEDNLRRLLGSPAVRVVSIDAETAEHYGRLHDFLRRQGTPIPINDLWIAASAAQHGLRIATLDGHFRNVPGLLIELLDE